MIRVDLTSGRELTDADIRRSGALPREVMDAAEAIVDDVRENGDAAVRAYCEKFDGSCPTSFRVPDELLDSATSMVDPEFLSSLELAHSQIREFHEREVTQSMFAARADGTILGVKVTPLPSVGIYVPGGRAQYPSTVLMNAVPAKVAGVRRIVMVTPPQRGSQGRRRRRGLRRRRRPGRRRAGLRHRDHPARGQDLRPGQRLRGRGQALRHG